MLGIARAHLDLGSVALDTGLSVDYDLATPVGLLSFFPLLFFHTDPRSNATMRVTLVNLSHWIRDQFWLLVIS